MPEQDDVTVNIGGNAEGAEQAARQAADSIRQMTEQFQQARQQIEYVSDAAKVLGQSFVDQNVAWLKAGQGAQDYGDRLTMLREQLALVGARQQESVTWLNELTASMSEQRQEMQYVADATQLLGADQAELNMTWLLAADNTTEYAARLSYLREQLALVRQEQSMMQESLGSMGSGGGLVGSFSELSGVLGGLGGMIAGPLGALGGFLSSTASTFTALIGQQLFNAGYQGLRNFFEGGLFGLNKQTEQNVYSWRYTYGQGMNPTDAMANAQAISKWSQDYSMDIPFTRQSLMTAISGAAPLGLDKEGLKHYFPIFSDLAATHINPFTGQPVDLGTVVQAVRGAEMGYSRMLKYDLNITPEDLVKYGLAGQGQGMGFKITDMTTLLPALEKYSEANGWTQFNGQGKDVGAAFNTAHATFWGSWSSFLDRIQNLELESGGGPFGALKEGLNFVSDWMDKHHDELVHIADVFGTLLTGAVKDLGKAFGGFFDGLGRAGIGKAIMDDMTNAGRWLADPNNQQNIRNFADALGQNLGNALSTLGQDFDKVSTGLGHLKDSISPAELQAMKDALGALGSIIQTSVQVVAGLADLLADYNLEMQAIGSGDVAGATHYRDRIGQDIQYIFGGSAPGPDNYGKTPPVDPNSASSGSVSVDQNGNPTGTPTVNSANNGQNGGDQAYKGGYSADAAFNLRYNLLPDLSNALNPNQSPQDRAGYMQLVQQYIQLIESQGSPFAPTNDPKLRAAQQQFMNDLNYINSNPNNQAGDAKAYADLQAQLAYIEQQLLKNKPGSGGVTGNGTGQPGSQGNGQGNGPGNGPGNWFSNMANMVNNADSWIAYDQAHGLLPSAQAAAQQGADYVSGLTQGMQRNLPMLGSTAQQMGVTISQQMLLGAAQHLGIGSGGGVSGIGPSSTLADLVKWTVAEALQSQGSGTWSESHQPGGYGRFGAYG